MAQPGNNIEQYEPSGWLGTFFLNSLRFPSSLRLFCFSRLADMEEQSEIPLIFLWPLPHHERIYRSMGRKILKYEKIAPPPLA